MFSELNHFNLYFKILKSQIFFPSHMGTFSMGCHKFHCTKISSQSKRTKYKSKFDLLRAYFTSCSLTLKQSFGRDPMELLNRNSHIQILVLLDMF